MCVQAAAEAKLEESFTVFLGSPLKTMHNLRLAAADPLEQLRASLHRLTETPAAGTSCVCEFECLVYSYVHIVLLLVHTSIPATEPKRSNCNCAASRRPTRTDYRWP